MTRKELINSKEYFAGIIANTLWNLEGEKRVKHWDEVGGKIADVIMPVVEEIKKFESQPTAGGVYPSVNTSYSENVKALGRKHSKEFEKILEEKSQPSPSNPPIKRPSQDEIRLEFNAMLADYGKYPPTEYYIWNRAINWLLSLQSDNKI